MKSEAAVLSGILDEAELPLAGEIGNLDHLQPAVGNLGRNRLYRHHAHTVGVVEEPFDALGRAQLHGNVELRQLQLLLRQRLFKDLEAARAALANDQRQLPQLVERNLVVPRQLAAGAGYAHQLVAHERGVVQVGLAAHPFDEPQVYAVLFDGPLDGTGVPVDERQLYLLELLAECGQIGG